MNETYVPQKMYSLSELERMELGKKTRPFSLQLDHETYEVKSWSDLMQFLVSFLIDRDYLKLSHLPIFNHAEKFRYLINDRGKHKHAEKKGYWKHIGDFYVDVKYNAEAHRKNILHLWKELQLQNEVQIGVSFR